VTDRVKAYWGLVRPRIVAMVLFAMAVAAWTAGEEKPSWQVMAHALSGTALLIVGAIALNQRLERRGDAKMLRTADRPLPAGRLSNREVTWFGVLASAAGLTYLFCCSGAGVFVVAIVSWVLYVWAYTPLKSVTVWQTPIGAVAGAMPVLLGAAAVRAPMSPMAVSLFAIVFFWQLPHAMAVAWLYRREFASAEVKLATVVDPSGHTAGVLALLGAAALLPVSLGPSLYGPAGWVYGLVAVWLGLGYLTYAFAFFQRRSDGSARALLRASVVYLPILFGVLLLQ